MTLPRFSIFRPKQFFTICFSLLCSFSFADFSYNDFSQASSINAVGSALVMNNQLFVTPNALGQAGAMWHSQAQLVDDGFVVEFEFQMSGGADGMTFIIQGISDSELGCVGGNPCGSSAIHGGSFLGYEGIPSIAIEFDTYDSGTTGDPNGNHVSIHTLGTAPNSVNENTASIAVATNPGVTLADNAVHSVRVEYSSGELKVFLDNTTTELLSVQVDIAMQLGAGPKWCGFTAATGGIAQSHAVLRWSFTATPIAEQFVRGDCNNDGGVSIPDVVFLLGYLFPTGAQPQLPCLDACDCNDNGTLNLPDVITQLNALFGMPPVPLPEPSVCGPDPTDTESFDCMEFAACP